MSSLGIRPTILILWFVLSLPAFGQDLVHKSYKLDGLPLKLGIMNHPEKPGGGINLAPKLKEFGIILEGYERCLYSAHARSVVILADQDDIELFEILIDGLYKAESLAASTRMMLEHIETLPADKRLAFIEKQGFFPDRFVDALALESLFAQENAEEPEAKLARRKLEEALATAIPYLRKQIEVTEQEAKPRETE